MISRTGIKMMHFVLLLMYYLWYIRCMKLFSNTNWNLYRSFIIVYEAGSYLRAEAILGMARNNIRANIATLNDQLGVELFKSHSRGITPTAAATNLYPIVKEAMSLIVKGENSLKTLDKNSKVTISVGMPGPAASILFVEFFLNLKADFPNMKFKFFDRANTDTLELLVQKKIDFIIDMEFNCLKHGFKTRDLFEVDYTFVATKKFLQERNLGLEITLEEFLTLPLVGHRSAVNQLSNETGIEFEPYIETATTEPILPYVKSGECIGYYIDGLIEKLNDDQLVSVRVKDLNLHKRKICIGYNKGHISPFAQSVMDKLFEHLKSKPFGTLLF